MKQRWQQLALRIDALSLRERAILFVVVLLCCLVLADTLWLSPAQVAHKQTLLLHTNQTQELQRLRNELKSMAAPVDANKLIRDEIEQGHQALDTINQEIRSVAPLAEGGPAIEPTLVQLLRRQEGLTLLGINTVPGPAGPAASAPNMPTRQAMEMRVSGSYANLTRYVSSLEAALPTLRWGVLQVKAAKPLPELTVEMYLLGVPR